MRRSELRAVLFDMDGVLIDSEDQWRRVEGDALGRLLPAWGDEDHRRVVGLGVEKLHAFLVEEYGLEQGWEDFRAAAEKMAEEVYGSRVSLAEGLLELVDDLRASAVPCGIATSSPRGWARMVVERFDLARRFPTVVTVDDVAGDGKPSPAIYLEAARRVCAPPGACVAIEDSSYGVEAAVRAGMTCLGFRNGTNGEQDLSKAHAEISGFRGLDAEALRKIAAGC